jgi:hypothetical protein
MNTEEYLDHDGLCHYHIAMGSGNTNATSSAESDTELAYDSAYSERPAPDSAKSAVPDTEPKRDGGIDRMGHWHAPCAFGIPSSSARTGLRGEFDPW